MIRKAIVVGVAAVSIAGVGAGCSSDDSSTSSSATTTVTPGASASAAISSAKATASSVVSSALNTAQQAIQDAINAALAAAPISFAPGSSDLNAVGNATIKAISLALKGNDSAITIETYANDGNPVAAKSLAEQRGNNIAAILEGEGIDKSRIKVEATINPSAETVDVDGAEISVTPS